MRGIRWRSVEIANNGHVEALMVALMMLGVWLLLRARRVAGATAIALAALAKPYAVFVLPPSGGGGTGACRSPSSRRLPSAICPISAPAGLCSAS